MASTMLKFAAACVIWGLVAYTGSLALVPVACFWVLWGVTDQLKKDW